MSGHSKWSKIKRQKGAADQKRGNIFTKLGKNISLAAKNGKDPDMNSGLRAAIDAARAANMPKSNIDKAILRGAGEIPGQILEEATYEGYGPNGVALIIETITDNKNRTISFIKSVLTKHNGSLGGPNSVAYMFDKKGVIRIEKTDEELQLKAIDAGAEDVIEEEGGLTIYSNPTDLENIKNQLGETDYAEIEMIPQNKVDVDEEKLDKLIEELETSDDISKIYTNANL